MTKKIDLDCDAIAALYTSGKSANEIGDIFDVSNVTILKRLKAHGVNIRDRFNCKMPPHGLDYANATYRNAKWLQYQYHELGLTQDEIAKLCDTNFGVIASWMRRLDVRRRTITESAATRANHVEMTNYFENFLSGLLMGDGYMDSRSNITAFYSHADKHKHYIKCLRKEFDLFGVERTGKIRERDTIVFGCPSRAYDFYTKSYVEFLPLYKKWYVNRKKIVPQDLFLNRTVCLNWYIGDGCLSNHPSGNSSISLFTNSFSKKDVLLLINKLAEIEILATRQSSRNTIRISTRSTPKFLDYIGPCPEEIWQCYGYKWDLTRSKAQWEAEFAHA